MESCNILFIFHHSLLHRFFTLLYFQTFNSIKASAKEKLADVHNGGKGRPLNRLEEKIIAIYGLDVLDGEQRLGEAGFNYKKVKHFLVFAFKASLAFDSRTL